MRLTNNTVSQKIQMFRQLTIYILSCLCINQIALADAQPKQMVPHWRQAAPIQGAKLKPGDKVFMMTSRIEDPFNSLHTIAEDGTVLPKFCKDRIKISGLNEVEASAIVLKHTGEQDVYNVKSGIKLHVVNAARFPKFLPKKIK